MSTEHILKVLKSGAEQLSFFSSNTRRVLWPIITWAILPYNSKAILLPSTGQLQAKYVHKILVACPGEKSVVLWNDDTDMTIAVD